MVHNIERHDDDDQYSNNELAKYKKMIKYSKKPFYHGCAAQYTRLFVMVKLFQLKASNRWSDYSFKDLLTLLKNKLPQGNAVPKTVYEAKQIIYIMGLRMKTLRNALFVDSANSIIEKTAVMMRTVIETKEKVGLKRCFGTFLSFLV
jgi:hypothetical protein